MPDRDTSLYFRPQVNLARSTTGRMWLVSCCAGLAILQSAATDGGASLLVALGAVFSAVMTELLFNLKTRGQTLKDGSAVASALILSLLLPNHIHPLFAALGAAFAMAVAKYSFGGLGANWVNPALGGWLFIRFSWPAAFHKALESSSFSLLADSLNRGFSDPQGSPLTLLKLSGAGGLPGAIPFLGGSPDEALTGIFNDTVFSLTGSELPGGYIDLLLARTPGIIADRGLLGLLLGTVIITASQVPRIWVPGVFLGIYALQVRIFGARPFGGPWGGGDILFGILSGGIIPAAFLLAADPATGPKSNAGALITAFLGGLAGFLFRYPGGEPYGAFWAVALLNVLVPLIRDFESRRLYRKRRSP
jgi:electron transport complex protein RnfD